MTPARFLPPLAALLLWAGASAWAAPLPRWRPLDQLSVGDRSLAEQALAPHFGDDPRLWPDWLEVVGVMIPAGIDGNILIVRAPMLQACGGWGYTVFGPVNAADSRDRWGPEFCANTLFIVPHGLGAPDIQFDEEGFTADFRTWSHEPARWRWVGGQWLRFTPKAMAGASSRGGAAE